MIFYDKEYIGKKFKEYRKKSKLTQEELSEKIGIAEKHYGKLERGAFYPSLETFFNVVDVLNIPLAEFGMQNGESQVDVKKEKIIKEIYSASDKEIDLYMEIISSIKNFNATK